MAFSSYVADALLNWLRGTAFPAAPTFLYFSLHSASPGMTGANECTDATYVRVAIAATGASFTAPANGGAGRRIASSVAITWPGLTAGFTCSHVGFWDALSGGNFLKGEALTASIAFLAGEAPTINAGDFTDTENTVP